VQVVAQTPQAMCALTTNIMHIGSVQVATSFPAIYEFREDKDT
jgi:hypothetical protein